uniref:NADH dehydrogenase subunit 2 n=1 Tax=Ironomyia nigromaculata TaxID=1262307 RepID=UPI0026E2366A|nr:NADH dehydrogenase subunit 2 [Ironomyia nigromaculata]WJW73658.1 NADH dehydrogenase subunit 2 [Ironomyia nigromaculata]
MFKNSAKILFFIILVSGTLITISSSSWLSAWMGLEINLLAFIPLVNTKNNLMSSEASLKYFLIQALASAVLLVAIIIYMIKFNFMNQFLMLNSYINMTMISALALKLGVAPFHFWFPMVLEGLSWMNALLLMTWQKIAPFMMMMYLNFSNMFYLLIIFSTVLGAWSGLNQTSLYKIMAFSSINHLGWMMSAMLLSESNWLLYFLLYSFLSFTIIFFFNIFKLSHINQLFTFPMNHKELKILMFLNFLSLGGLPPFLGFLPKWLVLQGMVFNSQLLVIFIMVMTSLITLFFYLRMCYFSFMLLHNCPKWMQFSSFNKFNMNVYMFFSFISVSGLLFINALFLYL